VLTEKLAAAQQALREKNAGRGPKLPLTFVTQLEPLVRKLLTDHEPLAKAMISTIQYMETVVTAETSAAEDRRRSSQTLCWLYEITLASQNSIARSEARRAEAQTRTARYNSIKATAKIRIAAERKKIKLKLKKALAEIAAEKITPAVKGINA
jgi:hypothetical protein